MKIGNCTTKNITTACLMLLTMGYLSQSMAALTYIADNRYLYYDSDSNSYIYTENTYPDAAFADFNQFSDQTSSLGVDGFDALGGGSRVHDESFNYESYYYWSYFDVTFNLDVSSLFDLSGTLQGRNDNNGYFGQPHTDTGSANASVILYSGTTLDVANIIFSDSISNLTNTLETKLFSYGDTLAAGDYRIQVVSNSERVSSASDFTNAWSTYDLTANVSAVPVPAAAWLFGSGLISLISIARRKKV